MRRGVLGLAVAVLAAAVTAGAVDSPPADAAKKDKPAAKFPWDDRVSDATRYARGRAGRVSFAVVDERGRIRGRNRGARYSSASLVKAMLLTAYVRRGSVRNRRLHGSERGLLGPMIRVSDNAAADSVMAQVGTSGRIPPGAVRR
jgi:beta-lactamase class A